MVTIATEGGNSVMISVLGVCGQPLGYDLLLGIDAIRALGGVALWPSGQIRIGSGQVPKCAAITINKPDFTVTFDQQSQAWIMAWKWSQDCAPEGLDNGVSEYPVAAEIQEDYKQELHLWMSNGWLVPYPEEKLGRPKGLIPLMAVLQQNKSKVRPVMDFQELNHQVDAFRANADICAAKLCEWPQKGSNISLLDLRRAYLQVCVHELLWPFQTMKIDGRRYCLIWLGFG